jgi:hypothetical protein
MRLTAPVLAIALAACGGGATRATPEPAAPARAAHRGHHGHRLVVEIAPLATDIPGGASLEAPMGTAAADAFAAEGSFATDGGPSAYRLDVTLSTLDVTGIAPALTVTCKVHLTMSTEPGRAIIGVATSTASVATDTRGVDAAKHDCAETLVRGLVTHQVIPALHDRDP